MTPPITIAEQAAFDLLAETKLDLDGVDDDERRAYLTDMSRIFAGCLQTAVARFVAHEATSIDYWRRETCSGAP